MQKYQPYTFWKFRKLDEQNWVIAKVHTWVVCNFAGVMLGLWPKDCA